MLSQFHVPVNSCPILFDPPFVLFLFWLGTAIGYRVLLLLRVPLHTASRLERGILCASLGTAMLQYLPYLLGISHHLSPFSIRIGLLLLPAVFGSDMFRVAGSLVRCFREKPQSYPPVWMVLGAGLVALLLLASFVKALAPPSDPDGLGYHLAAPKRWLQSGGMDYLPSLTHTNGPMGMEMLYLLTMALWSDTATKLIHFGYGCLTLLAIFQAGRRLKNAAVGFAAAILWLVGPHTAGALPGFSSAYVDLGCACLVLCTVLGWLLWRSTRQEAWLYCAALSAGIALSFKLTEGFIGIALAGTVLTEMLQERRSSAYILRLLVIVLGGTLLPALPWLLRAWHVTGNPVYPMLSDLFPTRDWDHHAARVFDLYFQYYNWGQSAAADKGLAYRIVVRNMTAFGVALGTGLAVWRTQDRTLRLLTGICGALFFVAIMTTGLYLRFFIPLTGLMLLIICAPFASVLSGNCWIQSGFILLLLLRTGTILRSDRHELKEAFLVSSGRMSRETFLAKDDLNHVWEYANARLPADARILSEPGPHGRSYYSDRYCIALASYVQRRVRVDTWENFLGDLKRDHLDYVVLQNEIWYDPPGPDDPIEHNRRPFALRLVTTYGHPLLHCGNYTLYRLDNVPDCRL